MPFTKKRTRGYAGPARTRPRKYRKKSFYPRKKTASKTVMKGPGPIPDRLFVKLKYADTFVTTAASVPAIHVFRTSIHDPDESGTGHQPMGHDEYSVLYNKYRVMGIAYRCIAMNESTTNQQDCVIIPKPNATGITTGNQLWEIPYSKPRVIAPEGSGRSTTVFKGYMSPSRILGITKEQYRTDVSYSATMGANPALTARLHLYSQPSDTSTTSTTRWKVNFVFYCELFDRHTLSTS